MTLGCDAQFAASLAETLDHSVDNMPMLAGPKPPPPRREDSDGPATVADAKATSKDKENTNKKARGAAPKAIPCCTNVNATSNTPEP